MHSLIAIFCREQLCFPASSKFDGEIYQTMKKNDVIWKTGFADFSKVFNINSESP